MFTYRWTTDVNIFKEVHTNVERKSLYSTSQTTGLYKQNRSTCKSQQINSLILELIVNFFCCVVQVIFYVNLNLNNGFTVTTVNSGYYEGAFALVGDTTNYNTIWVKSYGTASHVSSLILCQSLCANLFPIGRRKTSSYWKYWSLRRYYQIAEWYWTEWYL